MKRNLKILLVAFLCLILSSCSVIDADFSRIESPTVLKTPIDGKWTVTKIIFNEEEQESNDIFAYKDYIGRDVFITEKGIILGNKFIENPSFKAKKVELSRYLNRKFNVDEKKLNISGENLTIVDIYKDDNFLYEIIKVDEDKAFVYDNQNFIQINRVSNDVKKEEYEEALRRINPDQQDLEVEDE